MELRLNKSVLRKHKDEKQAGKAYNILLVDDERENLDSLSLVLDKEYKLAFANDGRHALEKLQEGDYPQPLHMIISDQRMPNMTGVEFLSEAKTLVPDAVRIILTGFTDAEAIISSINDGQIYKYLTKPIDPVDLRLTVRHALDYYTLEQENVQLVIDLKKRVKEVENMVKAFEQFVPRQFTDRVASEGVQNIDSIDIGKAETATVTTLFADIRNFTTLSEALSPQEVLDFLNTCFGYMGEAVHRYHGYVDKYIGDAIMALFDSPDESDQNQVQNAVRAALEMQQKLEEFNRQQQLAGRPTVTVGIGLHTGPVIIGTVGVQSRMDLTVLGDAVNVAARLEELTKIYDASVIISGSTRDLLGNDPAFQVEALDSLEVKGRSGKLDIYGVSLSGQT